MRCSGSSSTAFWGPTCCRRCLSTFGLSIVVQNGALQLFSADSRRIPLGGLEGEALKLGGLAFGIVPLMTIAAAVLTLGALHLAIYQTPEGAALRAVSDDPRGGAAGRRQQPARVRARHGDFAGDRGGRRVLSGRRAPISIRRSGRARLVFAFETVMIGGLGSLWGTLAGGVVLGLAQSAGAAIDAGMAVARRPCRVSRRAVLQAARAVPAARKLKR